MFMTRTGAFFSSLGPGILFAATSVGVSHLVQSTRAGAAFGLGMIAVIALAHLVKYYTFRAGSDYAAITGKSLLFAYKQQGTWSLILYAIVTISSMFIVLAAVTLVSAGLIKVVAGVNLSLAVVASAIVFVAAVLLIRGQYRWLEKITKVLIAILTVITIITTVAALPKIQVDSLVLMPPTWDIKTVLFAVALAGWMPTGLDASVWQSLWTMEKARKSDSVTAAQARRDFNIGYIATMILACCFLLIGASIMHGSGTTFSATAPGFAAQFIDIYAQTLGEWSRPFIGITALAVMLSTVITVIDGFPRTSAKWLVIMQQLRAPASDPQAAANAERQWYTRLIVIQAVGALCIIYFWLSSFKLLIDVAATISFVTAPVLAMLNHRAMTSDQIPAAQRLSNKSYWLSILCIACLSLFSLGYLYLLIFV